MLPFRRLLLSIIVCALCTGCDQDSFLSGQWFTSELEDDLDQARELGKRFGCTKSSDPDDPAKADDRLGCPVYMELSLGHYGDDVVGFLRLWEDDVAINPAEDLPCECRCQVIGGRYGGDALVFRVSAECLARLEAIDPAASPRVELLRSSSSEIRWEENAWGTLVMNKRLDEDQLTPDDKAECPVCETDAQ